MSSFYFTPGESTPVIKSPIENILRTDTRSPSTIRELREARLKFFENNALDEPLPDTKLSLENGDTITIVSNTVHSPLLSPFQSSGQTTFQYKPEPVLEFPIKITSPASPTTTRKRKSSKKIKHAIKVISKELDPRGIIKNKKDLQIYIRKYGLIAFRLHSLKKYLEEKTLSEEQLKHIVEVGHPKIMEYLLTSQLIDCVTYLRGTTSNFYSWQIYLESIISSAKVKIPVDLWKIWRERYPTLVSSM